MAKKRKVTESRTKQSIEKYLEEIGGYSPLAPEEEVELARQIRKSNGKALDKLVKANLRFVISVAKEYQGQGLPLQDLISEGNLGLIKAAQRFDETRGFKFISYAVWWIRQSILQALAEQSRVVRLPLNRVGAINKVGRALEELEKRFGREPSMEEIAEKMELTAYEVADVLKTSARHLSLDEPFKEEEGNSLLDVIESDRYAPPDEGLMQESLQVEIDKVLSTLKPREAEIIRLYFGLDGDRPLTLEEIGEHFKLTRERVRQIKEKALRRLRHRSRLEPLRKYLG
ncbi:MAG: RNA polymerase sigma factor RpoD/SigA [candidate division KSB1 bacterium]|nr:RNA polymerase sigma factor RpoD/SigA [candidate division KSB1 bacterium]MDZ7275866.1 RNA polymerase sigma factor RpoD/SigA [candidate division KSB1 bacterium]MDZ7287616.1 RNA polymerase sigma factor RpoD/SigA [candidate division KSB1 bacterium]MDZ7309446.1 RNA polymerase sigma factor RpoD/SigA [candidate division KSB1 bacterium]MDZ7350594.1 RNA polymerase sigma factor RpoD/SigA [candidate division KSB1 bacterium]